MKRDDVFWPNSSARAWARPFCPVCCGPGQQSGEPRITAEMLKTALAVSGLEFTDADRTAMVQTVNRNLANYEELHKFKIPNNVSPPYHFSALVPGMKVNRRREPIRLSAVSNIKRPANLEDVAFWPVRQLAELIRTRQVKPTELTTMYLDRLKRYNSKLQNTITFCDDLAMKQAKQADADIAGGKYKGPAARNSMGSERHHRGKGLSHHVGFAGLQGSGDR